MDEKLENSSNSYDELVEKYEELESLKKDLNYKIQNIKENGDEKTKNRLKKLKAHYDERKENIGEIDDENIDHTISTLKKIDSSVNFYTRFMNAFETDINIDPGRLMGLTDGIFGMVMTLLIFGMALPETEIANHIGFSNFIISIGPTIGITIVSFIFISSFWIYHHEFIKIKNLNILYLWINIFFLGSISFIPFTTTMIGTYSEYFLSEMIFGLNIFITVLLFTLMFYYANKRGFLENKVDDEERKHIYHTLIIIMGLTVVVNLLDYNISPKFIYLFLLIPIISTIREIMFKLKKGYAE